MKKTFVIDCFPESAVKYSKDHAIVVIDVIRATTTAVTAVGFGRRVFPVQTTDRAFIIKDDMPDAILAGELGGNVPYGFHMTNSPVAVTALQTVECGAFTAPERPIILLSSSGTQLMLNALDAESVYLACFRNYSAVADFISKKHQRIAIIGAGTRGRFRREDQIGCILVGDLLSKAGFTPENQDTKDLLKRWESVDFNTVREGMSADYLRRSGQVHDLEFVIHHIDDLSIVPQLEGGELIAASHDQT